MRHGLHLLIRERLTGLAGTVCTLVLLSSLPAPGPISEIMYHPLTRVGTNTLEYVELFNTSPMDIDLSGYRIAGDVDFTFPAGASIGARAFRVVARNPAAVSSYYGLGGVAGPLVGNFPNGGVPCGCATARTRSCSTCLTMMRCPGRSRPTGRGIRSCWHAPTTVRVMSKLGPPAG